MLTENTMITTGIISGLVCALLVAVIGVTLVSNTGSGLARHIGNMWRSFLRTTLGVVSFVVLGILAVVSLTSSTTETLQFTVSFAAAYIVGVTAYFAIRYGFRLNDR